MVYDIIQGHAVLWLAVIHHMHITMSFQDGDFQCDGMDNKVCDFNDEFELFKIYIKKKRYSDIKKMIISMNYLEVFRNLMM